MMDELVGIGQELGDYDLPDEFEVEVSDRSQPVMSTSDISMMMHEYDALKECALRAGYHAEELNNKAFGKKVRFFKPKL
jgi:hypothetical protein